MFLIFSLRLEDLKIVSCLVALRSLATATYIEEIETSAVDVYKDVLRPCKQNRVPLISPHSVVCYGVRLANLALAQELSCPTSVGMDVHVLSQSKLACWNSSAIGTVQADVKVVYLSI